MHVVFLFAPLCYDSRRRNSSSVADETNTKQSDLATAVSCHGLFCGPVPTACYAVITGSQFKTVEWGLIRMFCHCRLFGSNYMLCNSVLSGA